MIPLGGSIKGEYTWPFVYQVPRISVIPPDTAFEDMRRFVNVTSRGK